MRELAERTHRSAGEITGLIRATQEDTSAAVSAAEHGSARIAEGVQRAMASGEVLKRIHATSTTSAARTREIADATAQQAKDLDRVGVAVREIDEAVEAIRRSTKEQEQSSEEIAKAIESIRDLGMAVQDSTQQQRQGSSMISKASTQMSETLSQIVEATGAQSRSGETIEQTLRVFSEVSAETVRRRRRSPPPWRRCSSAPAGSRTSRAASAPARPTPPRAPRAPDGLPPALPLSSLRADYPAGVAGAGTRRRLPVQRVRSGYSRAKASKASAGSGRLT